MSGDPRNPGFFERGLGGFLDETHRFALDFVVVDSVDLRRKEVTVSSFNLMSPITCQWSSPLFNATTGNGLYVVPEVGSHGILAVVKDEPVFICFTGLLHHKDGDGFTDNREEIPPGAGCFRTSAESKQIWAKNFMLLQAANLCKMLFVRAKKQIQATFFNLLVTCLGGSVSWQAKTDGSRDVTFLWRWRDKTLPSRSINGQIQRDDALQMTMRVGAPQTRVESKIDDKKQFGRVRSPSERASNIFSLELDKPSHPKQIKIGAQTFGSGTESIQIKAFRDLLYDLLIKNRITNFDSARKHTALFPSLAKFLNPIEHKTVDLIVETLVGLAGYADSGNGEVLLRPEVGGFIDPKSSEVVGAKDSEGRPIPSNPLDEKEIDDTVVDEAEGLALARTAISEALGIGTSGDAASERLAATASAGSVGGNTATSDQLTDLIRATEGEAAANINRGISEAQANIAAGLREGQDALSSGLQEGQDRIAAGVAEGRARIAEGLNRSESETPQGGTGGLEDASVQVSRDRPLHDVLERARAVKDKTDSIKLTERFRVSVSEKGGVFIKHDEGAEWRMVKDMIIASDKGKFDVSTLNGVKMTGKGLCLLGNNACGMFFGQDGMVKIFGTGIELHPYVHTSKTGVTDKGTSVKIFPQGITITSGGGILMTARGQIRNTPGKLGLKGDSKSVNSIRNEAIVRSGVPAQAEAIKK